MINLERPSFITCPKMGDKSQGHGVTDKREKPTDSFRSMTRLGAIKEINSGS
jgi:hypothetical protein